MNVYKISYHVAGLGDTSTEARGRNEAEAKRNFKATEIGKAVPHSSISVEVIRENDLATKQEERDTLAAIRKMVEELGPQSYLATAFEGCFEDAESNIENDFGDSMKARWLHADAQLNAANGTIEELRERLSESEKDYEAAHAAAHAISDQKDAEIAALRERVLAPDDLTDVIQLVTEKRLALDAEVKNAAERIVEAAAEPESAAFQNAVKDHRAAKSSLDYYTALLERLVKARGE